MKHALTATMLMLASLTPTFANQVPKGLATDGRIKIINYDANNVTSIHGSHFVSTAINFSPSEVIQHVSMGDQLAWDVAVTKEAPNVLFIKPTLPKSDTNLTVLTNKHAYLFHVYTKESDTAQSKSVTYSLNFKYPAEEKKELEDSLSGLQKSISSGAANDAINWNYDYSFHGSKSLAPIQAFDNGTFTIFKFSKQQKIPAIFAVDEHQNERILNLRVQGDYVFVQGVRHQYTFRNGETIVTVYNDHQPA